MMFNPTFVFNGIKKTGYPVLWTSYAVNAFMVPIVHCRIWIISTCDRSPCTVRLIRS